MAGPMDSGKELWPPCHSHTVSLAVGPVDIPPEIPLASKLFTCVFTKAKNLRLELHNLYWRALLVVDAVVAVLVDGLHLVFRSKTFIRGTQLATSSAVKAKPRSSRMKMMTSACFLRQLRSPHATPGRTPWVPAARSCPRRTSGRQPLKSSQVLGTSSPQGLHRQALPLDGISQPDGAQAR